MIRTTLEVRKAKVNLRPRINCDKKDNENYLNVHKALSPFYDLHAKQADETLHAPQPVLFTYSNPAAFILVGNNLPEMNNVKK